MPTVTLALSVLLCIGALSDGSAAAAVVASSLSRHGTTASERESVATLLSSLNEAARKLCRVQTGQTAHLGQTHTDTPQLHEPTALRPYPTTVWVHLQPPIGEHLLNLPPPVKSC